MRSPYRGMHAIRAKKRKEMSRLNALTSVEAKTNPFPVLSRTGTDITDHT